MRRTRIYLSRSTSTTWFGRAIQAILLTAVIVLSLMFSVVIIPTILVLGLLIWGYVWWKTRALREQFKATAEAAQAMNASGSESDSTSKEDFESGTVIEGQATRVTDLSEPPSRQ